MALCPACASSRTVSTADRAPAPYRFLRCEECDLTFADPMTRVDGEWYRRQEMYAVRDRLQPPQLQWNHRQLLRDRPAPGGRLLDVGCGTGAFLAAARTAGYRSYGFDFDSEAVRTARERFGLEELFTGDLLRLKKETGWDRFDLVTAFEVLEHAPSPSEFFGAIRDLIAPGGFAAISVPNRDRRPRFQYDWDLPPNHLTRWSGKALAGLLERNGLRLLRTARGWRQGAGFLHQHLRFGLITGLLGKPKGSSSSSPSTIASGAYRMKAAAVRCLAAPLDLGLRLAGDTGMTLYALAQKTDGE